MRTGTAFFNGRLLGEQTWRTMSSMVHLFCCWFTCFVAWGGVNWDYVCFGVESEH